MSDGPEPAPDDLPSSIGRYRIEARLASDSVDVVYKGFDPFIERPVVLKVFLLRLGDQTEESEATGIFYREMRRVGALTHESIVTLFDAGEAPGALFMASEFVDGAGLTEFLAERPDLDLAMRVWIIAQTADALDYARAQGVAHLNLKPTNVLVGADGTVKLGGFGVAPILETIAQSPLFVPTAPFSRYVAPERALGQPGDFRADVFSLARLAQDILAGPGAAQGAGLPVYLADGGVRPDQWADVFARACSGDPDQRFQTASDLKFALLRLLGIDEFDARVAWETQKVLGQGGQDVGLGGEDTMAAYGQTGVPEEPAPTATAVGAPPDDPAETVLRPAGDEPQTVLERTRTADFRKPAGQ